MVDSDFVTALVVPIGALATKTVTPQGVKVAPPITHYQGTEIAVPDFGALLRLLTRLEAEPRALLVRGKIREGVDTAHMRRAHVTDPTLAEAAHKWLLLDLDKWREDVSAQDFAAAPAAYASLAREALPAPFRSTRCWWQATSGAGVKPGVRLRLAFWLDEALTDAQLKTWIKSWAIPVDTSLYTPSQPHYIAAPVMRGVADPLGGQPRSGVLEGAPEVQVPDLVETQADISRTFRAEDELANAARRVARTPQGGRRDTLNKLAFRLAERFPEDELSASRARETLLQAAEKGGFCDPKAVRTVEQALAQGRAKGAQRRAGWRGLLAVDDKTGNPRATQANTTLYLEHHDAWRTRAAWNERTQTAIWLEPPPYGGDVPRTVEDVDTVHVIEWFQTQAHLDAKPAWVRDGIVRLARGKSYDPIQSYLEALPKWDETPRAGSFFIRHFGVSDTALIRAQTQAWFLQAVRRAYATLDHPIQADYMIVLSGATGLRKSQTVRALCPVSGCFSDHLPDLADKDARLVVAKSWIIELSELTQRKADRDAVKAFLSATTDTFRAPYARDTVTVPRRCVFVATTNEGMFLSDPTGNRRFWPMHCVRRAEMDEVIGEREQVWAEVMHLAQAGMAAYLTDQLEAEARQAQEDAHVEDTIEERLCEALQRPAPLALMSPVAWREGQLFDCSRYIREIGTAQACELIGLPVFQAGNAARMREAFVRLGWTLHRNRARRAWLPPASWTYTGTIGAQKEAN